MGANISYGYSSPSSRQYNENFVDFPHDPRKTILNFARDIEKQIKLLNMRSYAENIFKNYYTPTVMILFNQNHHIT